jgi:hypothetical protein
MGKQVNNCPFRAEHTQAFWTLDFGTAPPFNSRLNKNASCHRTIQRIREFVI